MNHPVVYPPSPTDLPEGLTQAKSSYKRQAWLAMAGLIVFMGFYLALAACFGMIAFSHFQSLQSGGFDIFHLVVAVIALLLTIFMVKSLFSIRKSGNPGGVEVTAEEEPKLFEFLHQLADEIGAPKPHRVFITPEVNAAVFYDLSLINLIFPSKKNLIVGLGLVNVLNLGELKAVLAHEFGHFAQGSMMVGRWVYVAQQIIAHMVAARDWLDSVVRFISRIDLRIAWVGWILALVIWSIRSLMDILFRVVIIAERALSREMEFNADLVAVSVTGSDALVNALHKLQSADDAWQTTLDIADDQARDGKLINDLFSAQREAVNSIGQVLNDKTYGKVPQPEKEQDPSLHRVFTEDMARPPQMWSTHPANRDREDNAKGHYIPASIDERSAWLVFSDAQKMREQISLSFYRSDKLSELESVPPEQAVVQRFNKVSFASEYRGTYLNRSPVRHFSSIQEITQATKPQGDLPQALAELYPESIADELELARNLDLERNTLQALAAGDLKPSGGVIRHRGDEIKKSDIPHALESIAVERQAVAKTLMEHDANCRQVHLAIAQNYGQAWVDYLTNLIHLLHCSEHLGAVVSNEQSLLVNTWQVITADGQIGYFEKRRILSVCKDVQEKMRSVSEAIQAIHLPESIAVATEINDWAAQAPLFDLLDVDKKNWGDWCQTGSQVMNNMSYALGLIRAAALEEMIKTEALLANHIRQNTQAESAPLAGLCPADYPILLPGNEHVLQRKLDLWNRFQLAHGLAPTLMRLLVSMGIVGGTIYAGVIGF